MRLCLLMLVAIAATANADTGPLMMTCKEDWVLFHTFNEASCLKIMPEPKLFDDAFKTCLDENSRMLSFSHRMDKVYFINKMIIESKRGSESTMWFFDPTFMDRDAAKEAPPKDKDAAKEAPPKPEDWMVIKINKDIFKVELKPNSTAVPRSFMCESPAHPAAQRPQFQLEPEHLFIADFLTKPTAGPTPPPTTDKDSKDSKEQPRPFVVTFNCQAYGLPKPTVEWYLIHKAENQSLMTKAIDAKIITDPREPLKNPSMTTATFFNLQRDCKNNKCPPGSIQERSQLIVVNPQFLDLANGIVCLARNEFGSVLSREAQLIVTTMGDFANKEDKVTVKAGISAIVPNAIKTDPDAAASECFRINKPAAEGPAQLIPLEELNRMLDGAIQMSKATFDFIIDAARPEDAGDFLCRARLHNGRMGHVVREKIISLKVDPCVKTDNCDLEAKPVAVADGYPAVLSMNPLDNHIIRSGDDFLLECPCTGKRRPDEQLTVNWNLLNNTKLPAMMVPVMPQGSALLLTKATHETHSGAYFCQCLRGEQKSDWRSINIRVLPSTEPVDHREILTTKIGDKATYTCRVNADLPNLGVFVEPLHGVETLADFIARTGDSHIEITRDGPNQFSVVFNDFKEAYAGIYGCRVTVNYFGKWIEHDTYYTTVTIVK